MEIKLAFHSDEMNYSDRYIFCPTILKKDLDLSKYNIEKIITMKNEQDNILFPIFVMTKEEFDLFLHSYYTDIPKILIAVTGSSGKTSTCMHIAQILSIYYGRISTIGSDGYYEFENNRIVKSYTKYYNSTNQLGITLRAINNKSISISVIEVTSTAMKQGRIGNLFFNIGVFTNFSKDHLESHDNIEEYFQYKSNIMQRCNVAIIHESVQLQHVNKITFGSSNKCDFQYNEQSFDNRIKLDIKPEQCIDNIAAALSVLFYLDREIQFKSSILKTLYSPIGRMTYIDELTYVDYAHNGEEIKYIISKYQPEIILFGVGGDRGKERRKDIAISASQCPFVFITNDNNRTESHIDIHYDICKYMQHDNYIVIPRRYLALDIALQFNKKIIICGMGNESFLDAQGNKTNDIQYAKALRFWHRFINIIKPIEYSIKKYDMYPNLVYDTRIMSENSLFIAIQGNVHGHKYVNQAKYAIVEDKNIYLEYKDKLSNIIYVENSIEAILKYGSYQKKHCIKNTIAITGTCGKTSTKDILSYILDDVFCNEKSFNNEIGVPISMASIDKKYEYGIFELGINSKNEMKKLTNMLGNINIGIITNIGPGHIGNFNSIDEIVQEKTQLRADIMIIPYEYRSYYKDQQYITFGHEQSDIYIIDKQYKETSTIVTINSFEQIITYEINTLNQGIVNNSMIIFGLQNIYDLDINIIIKRLSYIQHTLHRGNIIEKNNITFIDDTYNSNPLSLQNAIDHMLKYKKKRYIAIIGEMKELGSFIYTDYITMLNDIDYILTYGNIDLSYMKSFYKNYNNVQNIVNDLKNLLREGDIVLIKGSRIMYMENIIEQCMKYL